MVLILKIKTNPFIMLSGDPLLAIQNTVLDVASLMRKNHSFENQTSIMITDTANDQLNFEKFSDSGGTCAHDLQVTSMLLCQLHY